MIRPFPGVVSNYNIHEKMKEGQQNMFNIYQSQHRVVVAGVVVVVVVVVLHFWKQKLALSIIDGCLSYVCLAAYQH